MAIRTIQPAKRLAPAIRGVVKNSNIAALTGLRGVAAGWVLLFHLQQYLGGHVPTANVGWIGASGFRGVDLFFVLSGFVLMHVHRRDFLRLGMEQLSRFAILRFTRVYPLNTVVLVAIGVMFAAAPHYRAYRFAEPGAFTALGFFQTLTLSTRWLAPDYGTWNGPTWSLSTEIIGYAGFPFLAHRLARIRTPATCLALVAACLGLLVIVLFASGHAEDNMIGRFGLLRMATCLVAGIILRQYAEVGRLKRPALVANLSAALVVVCAAVPPLGPFMPFGFAGLILGLLYQQGLLNRVLSSRPAVFCGQISFAFYLIHLTAILAFDWLLSTGVVPLSFGLPGILAVVAGCVALAWLLNVAVERPSQRFGRRWAAIASTPKPASLDVVNRAR